MLTVNLDKAAVAGVILDLGSELIAQGDGYLAEKLSEAMSIIPDDFICTCNTATGKPFQGLIKASEALNERSTVDGRHEDSFEYIANLWTEYISIVLPQNEGVITKKDVAFMMILLKMGRELETRKEDNIVDIIGYAALAYEM